MNWYIGVLKKYAVFSGRARRKEFWMFVLFNFIISFVLELIDGTVLSNLAIDAWGTKIGVLGVIYGMAVLIPSVAVAVRRLHDTNRTGWWYLIGLVPIIGAIILLIFFVQDSKPGDNKYGPNPKAGTVTAT
jgi:uncharacterized membrane protein YhaH (DUF805 family)